MDKKKATPAAKPKIVPPKPTKQVKATKKIIPPDPRKKAVMPTERMEKGRRATKAQHDQILIEVGKLISNLHTRRYIVEFVGKRWGLERTQVDKYIAEAKKAFHNELPDPARAQADLLEMLLDAEKAYRGRGMSHLMALKQIRELIAPTRVQIGGDPQGVPIATTETKTLEVTPTAILEAAEILRQCGAVKDDNTDTAE